MNIYPSLFLLLNNSHAQWYLVTAGNKVELIKEIRAEEYELSDHEGSFRGHGMVGAPDIMSKVKLAEEKKFFHQVADQTKQVLHEKQNSKAIIYASPKRIKNEIRELLEHACGQHTYKYISGNHVGGSKEKIMKLFKDSFTAFNE